MESQLKFFNRFFIGDLRHNLIEAKFEGLTQQQKYSLDIFLPDNLEAYIEQQCQQHFAETQKDYSEATVPDLYIVYKELQYLDKKCIEYSKESNKFPLPHLQKLINNLLISMESIRPFDYKEIERMYLDDNYQYIDKNSQNKLLVWHDKPSEFARRFYEFIKDKNISFEGKRDVNNIVRVLYNTFQIKCEPTAKKHKGQEISFESLLTYFKNESVENSNKNNKASELPPSKIT
jgi:hypothetical protein